jgi:hypothetical protein
MPEHRPRLTPLRIPPDVKVALRYSIEKNGLTFNQEVVRRLRESLANDQPAEKPPGPMLHDWTESTLGHGELMCRRCRMTNREAAVLGELYACEPLGR